MALVNIGCSDFLAKSTESEQTSDEYWQTKEEVWAVLMGVYSSMRTDLQMMLRWGELRGDVMVLDGYASSDGQYDDMLEFKNYTIYSDNVICKWVNAYQTILRCNTLIENAESVLAIDDTFEEELCKAYIAEAYWVRSLTYFRLVKTFRDVPYITWAYTSDTGGFTIAKSDGSDILDDVLNTLEQHYANIPDEHTSSDWSTNAWQNKGRATQGAYFALMADICLWQERYDETIQWCDSLDALNLYSLLDNSSWFNLYYPGNSDEGIFELQYSSTYSETNSLNAWFYNSSNYDYSISTSAVSSYAELSTVTDIRGAGGTYISDDDLRVWKYSGTTTGGSSTRSANDVNWIIYRYAEMLLIRAEALIMQGNYSEGSTLIDEIRTRAGYTTSTTYTTEATAIVALMDERKRELAFEGKRWYDLVRLSFINDGIYKSTFISTMLQDMSASNRLIYESRMQDSDGYYLPIYEDDIIASGGLLVQNPYYL